MAREDLLKLSRESQRLFAGGAQWVSVEETGRIRARELRETKE